LDHTEYHQVFFFPIVFILQHIFKMGATSSIRPEIFSAAKEEYEIRKLEGLTDEQLFNHMKSFIDAKTEALDKPDASSEGVIEDGIENPTGETVPSTPMVAFTAPTETAAEG
jgi:hypothetical protein